MELLYWLATLRNPVFDLFFSLITRCGEETVFMAIGLVVFWCVNKQKGYFLLSIGFLGTVINQFLKMCFRIPRPWVLDPAFLPVEGSTEAATGYSFPSGHTQTSVGLFGGIARVFRNKWVRIAMIVLCVLVPFSRMYLGVHTPYDVGVSILVALVLVFLGAPLFRKAERSSAMMYTIFSLLAVLMAAYLIFVTYYPFPAEAYLPENIHNLESARENGFTLMGCILGIFVIYTADIKWLHFPTKGVWWVQIIKAVVGLALVLAVKELLKLPLNAILPADSWARLVRYFLVVIVGGMLWPMTFGWFSRLGQKE